MLILTIIFGVSTLLGLVATIYYGRKSARLERERKKIDWSDLQACASDLASEMEGEFEPDLIYAPDLRGGTFANLLLGELKKSVPVYVGISRWKPAISDGTTWTIDGFTLLETNKWNMYVPEVIFQKSGERLLIVDDFAMSGDFLECAKNLFVNEGFAAKRIRTMCIASTRIARENRKAPDYKWMDVADLSFFFPWGKAR